MSYALEPHYFEHSYERWVDVAKKMQSWSFVCFKQYDAYRKDIGGQNSVGSGGSSTAIAGASSSGRVTSADSSTATTALAFVDSSSSNSSRSTAATTVAADISDDVAKNSS